MLTGHGRQVIPVDKVGKAGYHLGVTGPGGYHVPQTLRPMFQDARARLDFHSGSREGVQ